MATIALAQEKVWFEKASYDKAERLYFERLAKLGTCFKVVSRNIMESRSLKTEDSITGKHQDLINTNSIPTSKSEKSKDNKSLPLDNETNNISKHSKCQIKNSKNVRKENDRNMQKIENIDLKEKYDGLDMKEKELNTFNDSVKQYNAKEAKEKKNKADTRHRNRGKGKNYSEDLTEPLPDQGNQQSTCAFLAIGGSLANEVAKARQHIRQSLQCMDDIAAYAGVPNQDVGLRIAVLEKDNQDLRDVIQDLRVIIGKLGERVKNLEERQLCPPNIAICPAKPVVKPEKTVPKEDNDEDIDLFGSDSEGEDAEAAKIREERLAAYAAKKSKKPAVVAKSNIILDVKPWDDETDMNIMESEVRKIETDGLLWGASKLVPLAYGIKKLQISCVVEDDKVSVDWLTEKIQENEDFVQSVDIAAFNKI